MDSDYYSQSQNTNSQITQNVQAGTILKIQMKNFMCHDNLEVNLNPRINFMCGKNGSGKSAIQTAISVGLGGKALSTNRGSSLKALIKNDKNSCSIIIEMSNQGSLAYRVSDYGSIIRVERSFSHTSQGYKIKSASGKVVSTERQELDRITSQFNIQIENPICILHQDVARNFLSSSDPKNKYKFFLKASRLGDIAKLNADSIARIHIIRDNIDRKFEIVEEAFRDVVETKRKLKILEEAKEKEKLQENLENEAFWAKVHENNFKLQELQRRKEVEMSVKSKIEKNLNESQETTLKEKLRELEKRIIEIDDLVKDAKEKLSAAKQDAVVKKRKLIDFSQEFNEMKHSVRRSKQKYDSCLKEIEHINRTAKESESQQEKLNEEIAACGNTLEAIKAAQNNFEHDKQRLQDTIENITETLRNISERLNEIMRQRGKVEAQLREITKNANSLSVYGAHIMAIVDKINKAHGKFEKKPIGPIGLHIKVRDPSWAGAVENFLGKSFLSSFCVDNSRDAVVLSNLMNTVCAQYRSSTPTIINSKFLSKVHNIKSHETGTRQYMNLSRALDIDHPVVANCIIDQKEAEAVLLIPSNNEAYDILDEEHKVPRNCKIAFTITGDTFYPAPNYKSYSNNGPITHATLLQVRQEDVVRQMKSEINKFSEDLKFLENEKKHVQEQMGCTLDSLKKNESELRNLKKNRYNIEQKISELKVSLESVSESNLAYFIEESRVLKNQYEADLQKFQALQAKCDELKLESEEAGGIYRELQNTIAESDEQKAPIQMDIQELKTKLQQASTNSDLLKRRLQDQNDKINNIERAITSLTNTMAEHTEASSQFSNPINTQRTTDEIIAELNGVVRYLKKLEEENGGTLVQLQENFSERQQRFNAVNNSLNSLRNIGLRIKVGLRNRKGTEIRLLQVLSNSAKHNFQLFLSERNFDGKLEFDTKLETLEIKVKPMSETDSSLKKHETASLSGGEKSFSTVCFIMALWREVELPFHFLDEFDVFMDGINRRTVMDLLISYAKQTKQQFVFLTPLDTLIPASDIITIHRLEPPRE